MKFEESEKEESSYEIDKDVFVVVELDSIHLEIENIHYSLNEFSNRKEGSVTNSYESYLLSEFQIAEIIEILKMFPIGV